MCLDIPFSICGMGRCVNSSCVCNPGWSQNNEFFLGEITTDEVQFCDFNYTLVATIAGVLLACTSIMPVLYFIVIQNRKQVKGNWVVSTPTRSCFIMFEFEKLWWSWRFRADFDSGVWWCCDTRNVLTELQYCCPLLPFFCIVIVSRIVQGNAILTMHFSCDVRHLRLSV